MPQLYGNLTIDRHVALVALVMAHACTSVPPELRAYTGCFEVTVGPWNRPPLIVDPPDSPPDTVWLDLTPVSYRGTHLGRRVRPNIYAPPYHRDIPPSWELVGDTAKLTWTNGFSGVRLFVVPTDSGLVGRAEAFTDVIRIVESADGREQGVPWPTASIHMERAQCRGSAAA
jgi:hypothetical protein